MQVIDKEKRKSLATKYKSLAKKTQEKMQVIGKEKYTSSIKKGKLSTTKCKSSTKKNVIHQKKIQVIYQKKKEKKAFLDQNMQVIDQKNLHRSRKMHVVD